VEDTIRSHVYLAALENAVKHESVPKAGTVVGMVLGKHPELKIHARMVTSSATEVVAKVALMSGEERKRLLLELEPGFFENQAQKKTQEKTLPPLVEGEKGVVMRFAPNPSGPLHLGHARAAILNDEYVRRYGGRYVLRIEDTDPKRVDPAAYSLVVEDCEWLGLRISEVVYQSDRLDMYQEYAGKLIGLGGAYVCTCDNDRFREMRQHGAACPCRAGEVEDQLARWESMKDGNYAEGEASVRIKTDLGHPDPAMRDFPLFRILTSTIHPRVEATLYPLMNFSVAVDDHILGMTHVIRGKDHIANTRRQQYIFDYFGWNPPQYLHYGRMGIEGVILSTSQMRQGISEGAFTGWDDIRLGTLRALARRGIQPEAVRRSMTDIGIGETDISFSWDNLFARNRALVDFEADRFFFVDEPVRLDVEGAAPQVAHAMRYPGDEKRGCRVLSYQKTVFVPSREIPENGGLVRLKDLFNVYITSRDGVNVARYAGDALSDIRAAGAPIIQWLPAEESIPCVLHTPDGDRKGFCEPGVLDHAGRVVQFERVGFARIDLADMDGVVAYLTHR
jgi:glutamyl-tRNA synthetase